MGTPELAVSPLEHLMLNQYQVVAVYTQPDKPVGRGRSLAASPVKKATLAWKLPVVQPVSLKGAAVAEQLAGFHPDVIAVAAFGQILPQSILDIPSYGCINIHPSLLPRFRGASPVAAAILAGDEFTGVSVMSMDKGLDTGPVLSRAQIPISRQDTTGSLTRKLSLLGAQMLLDVLPRWSRGEITPQPQNEAEATYSATISKGEGEIDWQMSAVDIWRRVRAYYPWPGCFTRWRGKQLKIIEAEPLPRGKAREAGQVVGMEGTEVAFGIGAGDGILGVLKVQLEGKRAMPSAEFLRGQRQFIGSILPLT
ncbi:MAG: methionyl-tRNA formyltransferase [Dehalococcoidales bacterium]|jgi:methionyl-tRNA formyltransferase|nr:methionyl-tRNA formyltransferase [Dehalococcoidales bacterium]|tara:strand:- start:254 stop:1180 length:927 start_codon:yes stop_codon:yes gene_type:complete